MSKESRKLEIGDFAITDYNGSGGTTVVQIIDVDRDRMHGQSQSGILFRVLPLLRYGSTDTWYCADWFEPLKK